MSSPAHAAPLPLVWLSSCREAPAPAADFAAAPAAPATEAAAPARYTPHPVWCADGSGALCAVIPSFIGVDSALGGQGYQGLSNDVDNAGNDAQTPFDIRSWQMFVALNWQAGPVQWQGCAHPEDAFGDPTGLCDKPKGLARFDIIAKRGRQGSRNEEFIQDRRERNPGHKCTPPTQCADDGLSGPFEERRPGN